MSMWMNQTNSLYSITGVAGLQVRLYGVRFTRKGYPGEPRRPAPRNDDGLPFGEEAFHIFGGDLDGFGLTGDHHGGYFAYYTLDGTIQSSNNGLLNLGAG